MNQTTSAAVKWVKRFHETGSCVAKACGGSTSPLEKHADFLLTLVAKQPDLTLDEIVTIMRKHRIPGKRTSVWRFFQRHKITFKKKPAGSRTGAPRRDAGASTLEASTAHA